MQNIDHNVSSLNGNTYQLIRGTKNIKKFWMVVQRSPFFFIDLIEWGSITLHICVYVPLGRYLHLFIYLFIFIIIYIIWKSVYWGSIADPKTGLVDVVFRTMCILWFSATRYKDCPYKSTDKKVYSILHWAYISLQTTMSQYLLSENCKLVRIRIYKIKRQ